MLLLMEPVLSSGGLSSKVKRRPAVTNIRHVRERSLTSDRALASAPSTQSAVVATSVVRGSERDVKPDGNWSCRTSVMAIARWFQTTRNSPVAGSKNLCNRPACDSPRHHRRGIGPHADVDEHGFDTAATGRGDRPFRTRWPGNADSPDKPTSAAPPGGTWRCSNDSKDESLGTSLRSPSKDKAGAPAECRHLDRVANLDHAVVGPRGSRPRTVKSRCEAPTSQRGVFFQLSTIPSHHVPISSRIITATPPQNAIHS